MFKNIILSGMTALTATAAFANTGSQAFVQFLPLVLNFCNLLFFAYPSAAKTPKRPSK